jgi:hypothetical protein
MASRKINVSPAVITREVDLSQVPAAIARTGAAFVGLAERGPAFLPVPVADFGEFRVRFGNLNSDFYMPYGVQSYLRNANLANVVRVLGKGNPDAGYTVDLGKPFLLTFSNTGPSTILTSSSMSGALSADNAYYTLTANLNTNSIYDFSFSHTTTLSAAEFELSVIRVSDDNALQGDGSFVSTTASNSGMTVATVSSSTGVWSKRFKTEPIFKSDGSPDYDQNGANLYNITFRVFGTNTAVATSALISSFNPGEVLAVLRSRRDDSNIYDLIEDVSITGTPFDFDLKATWEDDTETILYNMSLDMTKKQYIGNFLGTDPEEAHFGDSVTGIYIDSILNYKLLDTTLSQTFQAASFTGSTSGVWIGTGSEYDDYRYITGGYQTGHTPTVVSQPYFANGEFTVYDLFTIYSLSDGEASNNDVKITITNIETVTSSPKIAPKFQIVVRKYDDTDRRLVAYETFTCDMDPESDTYIGRVIGDRRQNITIPTPGGEPEIVFDGEYPNKSNYIRVEISSGYPASARPSGFRGPSGINPDIPEDHTAGTGYEIDMPYKTDHLMESGSRSGRIFLGFDLEGSNTINVGDRLKGSYSAVDGAKQAKGFIITAVEEESMYNVLEYYKDYKNAVEYINSYNDATPWVGASGTVTWTHAATGTLTAEDVVYSNIDHVVTSGSSTAAPISGVVVSYSSATALVHAFTGDPSTYEALFVNMTGFSNYLTGYSNLLKYFIVVDTTRDTDYIVKDAYQFTMPLHGGHDGIPPFKSLIGAINDGTLSAEYISALQTIQNADEIDINLLFVPGVHSGANATNGKVPSIAVDICEDRADTLYVMDIGKPTTSFNRALITTEAMNTSVDEAVDAVFGYDSSYAAAYWPWVRIFDSEINRLVWVPPSVEIGGVYSYTDRISYPWNAPAGFTRGGLKSVYETRYRPSQTSRDTLYEGRINPIATFTGQGIVVYGQKTLQKQASALDRVNVRRLLLYARKTIASLSRLVQFENNTPRTQQRLVSLINPVLEDIQMKNGLTLFQVIIDETTNTPDVKDRNQLYGKILLQPARTIEVIILDFVITRTGASFEEAARAVNL